MTPANANQGAYFIPSQWELHMAARIAGVPVDQLGAWWRQRAAQTIADADSAYWWWQFRKRRRALAHAAHLLAAADRFEAMLADQRGERA